jgi:hypothetical protein
MPNGGASVLAINSLLLLIFDRQNFSVLFTFIKSEKFRGPAPSMSDEKKSSHARISYSYLPLGALAAVLIALRLYLDGSY